MFRPMQSGHGSVDIAGEGSSEGRERERNVMWARRMPVIGVELLFAFLVWSFQVPDETWPTRRAKYL